MRYVNFYDIVRLNHRIRKLVEADWVKLLQVPVDGISSVSNRGLHDEAVIAGVLHV